MKSLTFKKKIQHHGRFLIPKLMTYIDYLTNFLNSEYLKNGDNISF